MVERAEKLTTESILRAVLDCPRDIAILASDRQYRYLAFNEAHRRGMKDDLGVEIAVGMNVLELLPEAMAVRSKVNVDRALAGEHVVLIEELGEGDDPLKKMFFEVNYCPIFGADGTVLGQTIFHMNITAERHMLYELETHRAALEKKVEDRTTALRRSEELYRSLVQNAPISVFVHRDDTLLYVNPAAMTLCGANEPASLLRQPLASLVSPAVQPTTGSAFAERVVHGAQGSVDVEWTSIDVEFESGRATLSLAVDVSSRKRAAVERARLEEQMRETQKLESLGVLAGGVAHDFNNLLVATMGNADLALRAIRSGQIGPDLEVQVQRIKTAAVRAAELTAKLLAYSGKGRFVVRPLDLNEISREMADLASVSVPKGADLVLELAADLPAVEGDSAQIRQVVMNLLTNGAEALGTAGRRVRLRTSVENIGETDGVLEGVDDALRPGRYVCLEVSDDGAGMDETVRKRIFDPFFTTKTSGRGLGLAAVVGIARSHEGAIRVTSTPGQGSTFRVFLPCSELAVAEPVSEQAEEWRTSGTVLVADDEPRVRQVLTMMLADIGFDVLEAASAPSCLDLYRAHASSIDAVMVDLEMPGGGGREVVRVLRAEGHQVPVVVSSGYTEEAIGQELRADLHLSFLAKPFEYATFVRTLKDAVSSL